MKLRVLLPLACVMVISTSCIFSPKPENGGENPTGKWEEPVSPEKVVSNLKLAFDELDVEFYRKCLNDNYFYLSRSEVGDIDIRWNKSEDVSTVDNIMKGCTKFVFQAIENSTHEEYGENYPDIPDGAVVVEDHPNEMWVVVNYIVDMEIFTKTFGDYRVHQYMEFKFLKDPVTKQYSIILWNDLSNQ